MGNCTQPSSSSDAEQATIPLGSFAKNSFLRRSQAHQLQKNELSSGMMISMYIYAKCEGLLAAVLSDNFASSATLQTESDLMASQTDIEQDKLLINYTIKYGSQTYTWAEQNCSSLHKAQKLSIDYLLGQADQTVSLLLTIMSKL